MARTNFLSLAVVDLNGNAQFNDGQVAQIGDREYFKTALQGTTTVSDVLISRLTNEPEIVYAIVRIFIGRLEGYSLSDISDDTGFGETGYAHMINQEGITVAHPDRQRVKNQVNPIEAVQNDESLAPVATLFEKIIQEQKGVSQ